MSERLIHGIFRHRLMPVSLVLVALAALSGAWAGMARGTPSSLPDSKPEVGSQVALIPTATLKELMDSTVDPAADGLWDSVSEVSTAEGVVQHRPRTDEEWKAVRRHAITLVEAMNLVLIPGRRAAPAGTKPGLGELDPGEIDRRIEQSRPGFIAMANAVRGTAMQALAAIDRRDVDALFTVGGDIDAACEACHLTFWYPPPGSSPK